MEIKLVLGVDILLVLIDIICDVIKIGMVFIIDLVKIFGIVFLLGMMIGLIFVGILFI